jgi:endonuclease YncB( thermonuclease family)
VVHELRGRAGAPGWFARHRLLSGLLAALLLLWASGSVVGGEDEVEGAGNGGAAPPSASRSPEAEDRSADRASLGKDEKERSRQRSTSAPTPSQASAPSVPTYLVTRVVDGDTLELGNGETVRLVGIDTPEVGECGYERSSDALARLVLGRHVRLVVSDEDRDGYGRLLRYVDVGRTDAGLRLVEKGLAVARYDSRDGYGYHPREPRYVAADRRTRSAGCAGPVPLAGPPAPPAGCERGYQPCVPPYPPDVDCVDVLGPIAVTGPDPHGLDGEGDGIACE